MRFIDEMTHLAMPVIEQHGAELVDAEFKKEGSQQVLRFYVELKDGRIGIEDCAAISTDISALIDASEVQSDNFVLEVSSPGVNRVLNKEKDYIRFSGSKVDVSLYKTVEGMKKFTCLLSKYEDGAFVFTLDDGTALKINKEDVGKINLHFDFEF